MAGGYGGQLVALNITPYSELEAASIGNQRQRSALENDRFQNTLNPLRKSALETAVGSAQIDQARKSVDLEGAESGLKVQVQADDMRSRALGRASVAEAAAYANSPEEWDAAMERVANSGSPEARQYIGRYTPALKKQITALYGAASPLAAARGDGQSIVEEKPLTPQQEAAMNAQFEGQTPQQMQALYENISRYRPAIQRVMTSPDPEGAWNKEVTALGHPEMKIPAGQKLNQADIDRLWSIAGQTEQYLSKRLSLQNAGMPAPLPEMKVQGVGGDLVAFNANNPQASTSRVIAEGPDKRTLIGTDPETGVGIYIDEEGNEVKGTTRLAAKPGGSGSGGRMSVFELKYKAWLDLHPEDKAGALEYAQGRRTMTTPAMRQFAEAQAARNMSNQILGGTVIDDPGEWQRVETERIFQDMNVAAAVDAPPRGAPSQRPAPAAPAPAARPAGPPQRSVDFLKKNPSAAVRAQFDAKYGAGSAARVLGR